MKLILVHNEIVIELLKNILLRCFFFNTGLNWPLCYRTTEQWLTITLLYVGTMASPSLAKYPLIHDNYAITVSLPHTATARQPEMRKSLLFCICSHNGKFRQLEINST